MLTSLSKSSILKRNILVGDRLPNFTLPIVHLQPNDSLLEVKLPIDSLFTGKKSLLIGHPGAYTKFSTDSMIPDYLNSTSSFQSLGINQLVFLSCNDSYVISAYVKKYRFLAPMICDFNSELSAYLRVSLPADKYFSRISRRFVSYIDEEGTVLGVTGEDNVQYTELTKPLAVTNLLKKIL
jgi:peroxiredoxin